MVVTIFRFRSRADLPLEILLRMERVHVRMRELAASTPGYISCKEFTAADDETVTLVEFDTYEHQKVWRDHPEHLAMQKWLRDKAFSEYQIQVCETTHMAQFSTVPRRRHLILLR